MNCYQCTCENPTCSCTPVEVTAFKDRNGKLHDTYAKAIASDIEDCVYKKLHADGYTGTYGISSWGISKVLGALADLNLLKID